jgi:hypothetical protein
MYKIICERKHGGKVDIEQHATDVQIKPVKSAICIFIG